MRLPKSSLVAAACLLTVAPAFAYEDVTLLPGVTSIDSNGNVSSTPSTTIPPVTLINGMLYNPTGGSNATMVEVRIAAGQTLYINSEYATTLNANFIEGRDDGSLVLPSETDVAQMVTASNFVVYKTDLATLLPIGGNVVKRGGGILQLNSFTSIGDTGNRNPGVGPDSFISYPNINWPYIAGPGSDGTTPPDLSPDILDAPDPRNASRLNGIQGTFTIEQGTVRLSGFLNTWHDFGKGDTTTIPGPPLIRPPVAVETADGANDDFLGDDGNHFAGALVARRMTGVHSVILNGSSVLEFTNSPLNTPNENSTSLAQGQALRLNFVHNVRAGLTDDQFQTEIIAGTTSEYRIVIHQDQDTAGSIGILAGAGSFIKTGAGSLTILNESRVTGDYTAAGGRTILDTAAGLALASAASVNLAGKSDTADSGKQETSGTETGSRRGLYVRLIDSEGFDLNGDGTNDVTQFKEAFSPDVGTHTVSRNDAGQLVETVTGAELEIRQDQTIRNFQSNFALKSAPTDATTVDNIKRGSAASAIQAAADNDGKGEPVIAGTGAGANLILNGHTLTILQDAQRDGFYEGDLTGGFDYHAEVVDTGGAPTARTFRLAFDQAPDFGAFRLAGDTVGGEGTYITDAIRVGSADELRAALASSLSLTESQVTVELDDSGTFGNLVYNITLAADASVTTAGNLVSGKIVLNATDDAAQLALRPTTNSVAEIEVVRGKLIASTEALGQGRVNISSGELRVYQDTTGSLDATLIGGGTLRAVASALIDNGSGTLIEINSGGLIGTLNFGIQQRQFTGDLIVNDGINVSLSSASGLVNNTLLNARSITLDGTASGVGSILSFNNTDQLVRDLQGDALSRIDLGRGSMTLEVVSGRTFLGGISGVGSLIKRGSVGFTLQGNGKDDYTGATIVQQGSLTLASADAIRKTSALVLLAGTGVDAGGRNQTIGALFGEAGSTLAMGAGILTVGFTPARYTALQTEIAAATSATTLPLSHNYLGTTESLPFLSFDRTPLRLGSYLYPAPTEQNYLDLDSVLFADGEEMISMRGMTRLYLERVAFRSDRDGNGSVSAAEIATAEASAATLAFDGVITGTGSAQNVRYGAVNINPLVTLNKTGRETLTLTGNNTFTGAAVVRQGTLEVEAGSLASTVGIYVLANSSTIDLEGDGVSEAVALLDIDNNPVLGIDYDGDGFLTDADHVFDGTLAVRVASGTASWSGVILGDGNFRKTGAGTLVLDPAAAQYTGTTTVGEGTLDLTLVETAAGSGLATLGDVNVAHGATLLLRTPAAFTAASSISYVAPEGIFGGFDNLGNFGGNVTKAGAGTLVVNGIDDGAGNLTSRILVGGTIRVQEGVLAVDTLPTFGAFETLSIDSGATFRITFGDTSNEWLAAEITGAGTLERTGTGYLLIAQDPDPAPAAGSTGFTGTLSLKGGTTELGLPGSLPNAHLYLAASATPGDTTTLWLGAGAYAFAGLAGELGTVIDLLAPPGGTTLTLTVGSGQDDFLGQFTGFGDLVKEGDGALRLAPGNALANQINDITVNAGKLIATIDGIGNANSVTVNAGAALEFEGDTLWSDRTQPAPAAITYTADITGAGSISKSGTGDILLSGTGSLPTGDISVLEGTLIVDDRRVFGAIPNVAVSKGATFELLLTGDRNLASQITGEGGFSVNGAHLLTLLNQPTYTGLTRLRNDADLAFDAAVPSPVLHGLAADAADNIVYLRPGSTLTIIQDDANDATDPKQFAGQFVMSAPGTADLVIQGATPFRYTANSGNLGGFGGAVTVEGGILQVGLANTKLITLSQGGTLQIFAALGEDASYDADIVIADGSSELVKVGAGTLDLTGGLPNVSGPGTFEHLRVQEGMARVAINANGIVGVNQLAVSGTGALELSVASGTATINAAITAAIANGTGGSLTKTGAGKLILVAGITTDADFTVAAGTLQLGASAASACQITGDVTVDALASLTGAGTIGGDLSVAGKLAPGYSPGTLAVTGALTFETGSTYDVEVSGSLADTTLVQGAFAIEAGTTLKVTGWDNPATASVVEGGTPGDRHAIVVATSAVDGIDAGDRFGSVTTTPYGATTPQSVGYLVAYPGDTLGRAGEINVYVTRATQAGAATAASLAPGGITGVDPALVARLSELARVEVDAGGVVTDLTTGDFGKRLAILSPTAAPGAIRSLTGISYLAGLGMAQFAASGDAEQLAQRLEQRRYDRGYMSVKPREFYVTATSGSWKAGDETYAPSYDINRTGALAGYDRDLGPDSVIGWALALDRSKASLHGGGSVESTHARAMGYFSTMLADETGYVEAGASLGAASMSVVRSQAALGATSSPSAFTAAAWARLGSGLLLAPRTSFSPFVQLDLSYVNQSAVTETGDVDTKLSVDALRQTALRGRAGFSLAQAWDSDHGDWRYRLSLDVAYVASLSGEEVRTTAHNGGLLGNNGTEDIVATADPLDRGGLVFAPALTFGPDNDTTYSVSTEFRRLGGGDATSVNLTYRRRF